VLPEGGGGFTDAAAPPPMDDAGPCQCPTGDLCTGCQGADNFCAAPCVQGEFPCPPSETCAQGYCVPVCCVSGCSAPTQCDPGSGSCVGGDGGWSFGGSNSGSGGPGTSGGSSGSEASGSSGASGSGGSGAGGTGSGVPGFDGDGGGEGGLADSGANIGKSSGCGCVVVDVPGSSAVAVFVCTLFGTALATRRRRRR
jgi:hypothetical protein